MAKMQQRGVFDFGLAFFFLAVLLRINVNTIFHTFIWSGNAMELSPQYKLMLAWNDVFDVLMLAGCAIAIIGWFVPPKK